MNEMYKKTWDDYQELVLAYMERNDKWQEKANESLIQIKVEIAMLKVKSAAWGAVAAIILTAVLNFSFTVFAEKPQNVINLQKQQQEIELLKKEMNNIKNQTQ